MTKLIGLGDLFKNSWTIYREKFWTLVGLLIIPFLIMVLNQALAATGNTMALPLAFIIGLVGAIATIWGGAGVIFVLKERNQTLSIKSAYGLAWAKLLSLIWVAILSGIIVGGGFILLVIPGIIFAIWFLFSQVLVVAEDDKGLSAFTKSREYIRDYFWPVLGRYFVVAIAMLIAYAILSAIAAAIVGAIGGMNTLSGAIIFSLLGAIINVLIVPFALIAVYLLYENLKQVKGAVTISSTNKSGVWCLVIGLIGWVVIIIVGLFFMSVLVSLLAGLFVGQALSGLNQSVVDSATSTLPIPTAMPASLTPEQQQQLQAQMEAVKKLQDQLKQLKGLPANTPAE